MFLETEERIINLIKVSTINIIKNEKKIVFNLNYSIDLDGKNIISDYIYWKAHNISDFKNNVEFLKTHLYFKNNFISSFNCSEYININEISSVKCEDKKYRVIFNLSHPVTFKNYSGKNKITSEFLFIGCKTNIGYMQYVNYIKAMLLKKGE